MESLTRLEADMATKTMNPCSLLQLTMRFLSLLFNVFFSPSFDIIIHQDVLLGLPPLLRMVIRLKLSECELPVTLRQKLRNEQKIMMVEEELDMLARALRPCSRSIKRPAARIPNT